MTDQNSTANAPAATSIRGALEAETPAAVEPAGSPPAAVTNVESGTGDAPGETVRGALEAAPKSEAPAWATGVPDHMLGETAEDTLAKVTAGYLGARQKLSNNSEDPAPATAGDYKFEMPEKYTEAFGDAAEDPVLKKFAERAHGLGVGPKAAQDIVAGFVEDAMEAGVYEVPMSVDDFYGELGGKEEGAKLVGNVNGYIKTLVASGRFGDVSTPEGKAQADKMASAAMDMAALSPDAVRVFEYLRSAQKEPAMVLPGAGETAGEALNTRAALRGAMKDPRYDPNSQTHDPAFRKLVDAKYDALDRT